MDAHFLFDALQQEFNLDSLDPRFGCVPLAHCAGTWMREKKLIVGRVWALPTTTHRPHISGNPVWFPESEGCQPKFKAPLLSTSHEPLKAAYLGSDPVTGFPTGIKENKNQDLTWTSHAAAFAEDINGKSIVFDPAIFDGPVCLPVWRDLFKEGAIVTKTKWNEAPVYGVWGAPHDVAVQNDHEPDITPYYEAYIRCAASITSALDYQRRPAPAASYQLKTLAK